MEESLDPKYAELRESYCEMLSDARKAKSEAEALAREVTEKLLQITGDEEQWEMASGRSASVVRPTSVKVNEDELRARVGEEVWGQITKPVLDDNLLSGAISKGIVSIEVVSDCSTVTHRSPYIRLSK
jgi:uncharacterized protein (DUF342 family)